MRKVLVLTSVLLVAATSAYGLVVGSGNQVIVDGVPSTLAGGGVGVEVDPIFVAWTGSVPTVTFDDVHAGMVYANTHYYLTNELTTFVDKFGTRQGSIIFGVSQADAHMEAFGTNANPGELWLVAGPTNSLTTSGSILFYARNGYASGTTGFAGRVTGDGEWYFAGHSLNDTGHVLPQGSLAYDLGSATQVWRFAYVSNMWVRGSLTDTDGNTGATNEFLMATGDGRTAWSTPSGGGGVWTEEQDSGGFPLIAVFGSVTNAIVITETSITFTVGGQEITLPQFQGF